MPVFGPVSITFNGAALGKTFQGGAYKIDTVTQNPMSKTGDLRTFATDGTGTISLFSPIKGTLLSDTSVGGYGVLVMANPSLTITFHEAKLFLPIGLGFGTNRQQSFTINFYFRKNTEGQLVTLS